MEHDVEWPVGTRRRVPAERRLPDDLGLDGLSLDQVRRTQARLLERGWWGEADQVVREVVDLLATGPARVSGPQSGRPGARAGRPVAGQRAVRPRGRVGAARGAAARRAGRIAEEQYLTVRTVEFHLSRVYRKLGLAGRRDLKAILTPLS